MSNRQLTVGLLAHVDAGKTTLSEGLMYTAGALRKWGRVDHGDTLLDNEAMERERGITIFSKQARLHWQGTDVTLVDTPGHADFAGEAERTLQVLDVAVLVISGADGVQAHTVTLWKLLRQYRVPVMLWFNKMDQPGADRAQLTADVARKLDGGCVDMDAPDAMEQLAMGSEEALDAYLRRGTVDGATVRALVSQRRVFPCFFGSALKLTGLEKLLDALVRYGPSPVYPAGFSARIYKIARDPQGARLSYMKITGGCLHVKDVLRKADDGGAAWEGKADQIRLYSGARFQAADSAPAGTLCAVTGLGEARSGDGVGLARPGERPLTEPVFAYRVLPPAGTDETTLLRCLRQLEEEDPQLHVTWRQDDRQVLVRLMGEVQLEVLRRLLLDRYRLNVAFEDAGVVYRETIAAPVEGIGHFEPLRHYAEVHLLLTPLPRGSGLQFDTVCPEDTLARSWQRLILTHLAETEHPGVLTGAPVTDMRITLLSGRAHLKHTEGGDFRQATYRAVRQGLMKAESVLLEPWYRVRLALPPENLGRAMADLQKMGGRFLPPEQTGDAAVLTGSAPAQALRRYDREVASYTHGRGSVQCELDGYAPCRDADAAVARAGYRAESDPERPCGSVFCAHGAGFNVPWDQVEKYMHLPAWTGGRKTAADGMEDRAGSPDGGQTPSSAPTSTPAPRPARPAPVRDALEEDRELMAIFERTYGPVKNASLRPVRRETPPAAQPVVLRPPEKEYLLVDGYNIIFAWDELRLLARDGLETARQALMDILCNYRGVRDCEVILVYDAYKVSGNPGTVEKYHNIYVVYTREAETADSYIEKTTYALDRRHRVRVATSDGMEQLIVLGHGAQRVPAGEFHREVEAAEGEIRTVLDKMNLRAPSDAARQAMREAWRNKAEK